MQSLFQKIAPYVVGNDALRIPQYEAFDVLKDRAATGTGADLGIVLPVGCGKSGLITITPFALGSSRALVVAPGIKIATQLYKDFHPAQDDCFYRKYGVIAAAPYPEPVEIRGKKSNLGDLREADVVITNIHQLQGTENRWLNALPEDFFDLIIFDEGHHNAAESWRLLMEKFPDATTVSYSATPLRADGKKMAGEIIYTFSVTEAIQRGYVKRLTALLLSPQTLKYVREEDGKEIEVDIEEVKRLGEEDSKFRRSIVTSKETLDTIVNASLRELDRLRNETGCKTLKVIASALNYQHCHQIVRAFRERDRRADYVHSNEIGDHNERVLRELDADLLDVIVQVRKLSEGFNHPKLAVAAVFSVFNHLSPFVQFVGRIMRTIKTDDPSSPLNQGVVIFHAGSNIAKRWDDFRDFCEADQEYFAELLPIEVIPFDSSGQHRTVPFSPPAINSVEIRDQSDIRIEELPLLAEDEEAMKALRVLQSKGYTLDDIRRVYEPVPVTKADVNSARIRALDPRVQNSTKQLLAIAGIPGGGSQLDKNRQGRTNFVVVKALLDRKINDLAGIGNASRANLTRPQLDLIEREFDALTEQVSKELFGGI